MLKAATLILLLLFTRPSVRAQEGLPLSRTFIGQERFHQLINRAEAENWSGLPIGERVARFALHLRGVPYKGFTLEIDDRIEAPSVNFQGLDCWTLFESAMGMARMVEAGKGPYRHEDLLKQIEITRYRGGQCHGHYLDRLHYLADWYFDNHARGTLVDLTGKLGGVPFKNRECREMTKLWKSYRYLRQNPSYRSGMAVHEKRVSAMPVHYIPRSQVKAVAPKLRNGDVIGIATKNQGGFCSHVGVAFRDAKGVLRFLHASSDAKKVILDQSLEKYLYRYQKNIGFLVGRPLPVSRTITNQRTYRRNFAKLTKR